MKYGVWIFFAGAMLFSGTVFAQQAERLPGVIDRDRPEILPGRDAFQEFPEDVLKPALPRKESLRPVRTALIREIRVEGVTVLPPDKITKITEAYLGRSLNERDIADLKYAITAAYFDEGYILVKVVTPEQDLSQDTLHLQVIEGRVETITQNGVTLKPAVVDGLMRRVRKDDVFNEKPLETALNDVNDLTNVQARLRLEPGEEFAHTKLNLDLEKVDEDIQRLEVNNYGSPLVGRAVSTLDLQKSNLLALGETLGARLTYGLEDNLTGWRLGWASPVPETDWKLDASYSQSDLDIEGRLSALELTGNSKIAQLGLSHNFLNTAREKLGFRLGLERREHESFLSDMPETDDRLTKLNGEVSWLQRWDGTAMLAQMDVSRGIDAFDSTQEGDSDATRMQGNNEAWIFNPSLLVQRRTWGSDSISALVRGQWASNVLLSSDLFSIGGYGSVRGYDPASETGEAGFNATLEYRRELYHTDRLSMAARPFIDAATVSNRLDNNGDDDMLYGAGIGLDVAFDTLIPHTKKTTFRLDAAHGFGGGDDSAQRGFFLFASFRQEF